jgi:hypothetical protein
VSRPAYHWPRVGICRQRHTPHAQYPPILRSPITAYREGPSPSILVHDGRSNQEIGELFIGRKTVEYHLRKAFTELGTNHGTPRAGAAPRLSHAAG